MSRQPHSFAIESRVRVPATRDPLLLCRAGQCVRPEMNCGSNGYDFASVAETDLTVDDFDVTGVVCQGTCTAPCTATASVCSADGEPYTVTGCNCGAPPAPAPPPPPPPECTDSDDCKWHEACDEDQTCEFWGFVHWCVYRLHASSSPAESLTCGVHAWCACYRYRGSAQGLVLALSMLLLRRWRRCNYDGREREWRLWCG